MSKRQNGHSFNWPFWRLLFTRGHPARDAPTAALCHILHDTAALPASELKRVPDLLQFAAVGISHTRTYTLYSFIFIHRR